MKTYITILALVLFSCSKDVQKQSFAKDIQNAAKPLQYDSTGNVINVILLMFDGYQMPTNNWSATGMTLDPSGLDSAQKKYVLDSVSKDFKYQYNTITTDENLFNQALPGHRQRIVLTTTYGWYSARYGGTSLRLSFTHETDNPAFIFTSLLNYNTRTIRAATSHEIGHTYGLYHQSQGGGAIMNGSGTAYGQAWIFWATGTNVIGDLQYDGRMMEAVNGGKYDGQMVFLKYGTY